MSFPSAWPARCWPGFSAVRSRNPPHRPPPQPTPAATAAPTPAAETPVVSAAALPSLLGERETLYDPDLAPNVPAFAIADDFSNLANADELAYWSEEARAMLHENGFITVQTNEYEFYSLYERNPLQLQPELCHRRFHAPYLPPLLPLSAKAG